MTSSNNLLTEDQIAEETGIPSGTLRQWRYLRKGPRYIKLGKHVRYRRADVERYLAEQTVDPSEVA